MRIFFVSLTLLSLACIGHGYHSVVGYRALAGYDGECEKGQTFCNDMCYVGECKCCPDNCYWPLESNCCSGGGACPVERTCCSLEGSSDPACCTSSQVCCPKLRTCCSKSLGCGETKCGKN